MSSTSAGGGAELPGTATPEHSPAMTSPRSSGDSRRPIAPTTTTHHATTMQTNPDRLTPLLTVTDVAEILGVTPRTVRRIADRGELPRVRLGRRSVRFEQSAVEEFIARHTEAPDA